MSAPTPAHATSPTWEEAMRPESGAAGSTPEARRLEVVAFRLAGDAYAVSISQVREIVRLRPITPVPRVPDAVCGVISLRGEIAQVIDLRRCLGLASAEPTRASRILVLQGEEEGVCGLLVDEVSGVLRIDEDATLAPPLGEGDFVVALCPRGDEFVSLLDLDRVFAIGIGS